MDRRALPSFVLGLGLLAAVLLTPAAQAQFTCANTFPPLMRVTYDDGLAVSVITSEPSLQTNLDHATATWDSVNCRGAGGGAFNRPPFSVSQQPSGRGAGDTRTNSILIDWQHGVTAPTTSAGVTIAEWDGPNNRIILYGKLPNGDDILWNDPALQGVITHELGHALGLSHDDCAGSVMQGPGILIDAGATPSVEQCGAVERVQSPVCSTKKAPLTKFFFRGCPTGCECPQGTDFDDPLGGLGACDLFGTLCPGDEPFPWYSGFYTVECTMTGNASGSYTEVTCREIYTYLSTDPLITSPSGLSGAGPAITLASLVEGQRVAGTIPISGSVVAPTYGLQGLELWIDNTHVNLNNFLRGLPSSASCTHPLGGSDPNCPNIGFSGMLDTTTLSEGPHVLKIVALDARDPYPVPSIVQRGFVVDNICDDSTPPTVSLSSPAAGSTVRGTVTVTAAASDNVGVTKVELLVDGAFSANDSTPPYVFAWSSTAVPDGAHTLRVRSFDACGNTAMSPPISVTVQQDGTAPQVSLTAPAAGALVARTVSVTASASDDVAVTRVELFVDGALTATDTTAPYAFSWNSAAVADGSHTLQAKAWDAASHSTLSTALPVKVDNTVPLLWVDAPAGGEVTGGTAYQILGWATDPNRVLSLAFTLDGVPLALNAPYFYGVGRSDVCAVHPGDPGCPNIGFAATFNTTRFASGAHTLQVSATDAAGNVATFNRAFSINNDLTAPQVSLTAPAAGALVARTVSVTANASDDVGVTKVELYVDGALSATDTTAPYAFAWNSAAVADGNHTLQAKAWDAASHSTLSASVQVKVDNTIPQMWIDAPAGGEVVAGTSYQILGWATDPSRVVSLAFTLDGASLALNAPYFYGVGRSDVCSVHPGDPGCPNVGFAATFDSTRFAAGSHTLQVSATDAAGNVATFNRSFSINNDLTPPAVSFTAPGAGATVSGSVTVTATATDNVGVTKVELYADGALIATDTTAPYSFTWGTTGLSEGGHTLTLKAYDARPNSTSVSRSVTVDNLQPRIRIVSGDGVTITSGATYNFPSTPVNVNVPRGFTIFNDGNDVLNITNPAALVSGSAAFSENISAPASIAAGSSGAFRVRLLSATAGTFTATVTVQSNTTTFTFTVRGTVTP
jgi:hypothetical protein